MPHFHGNQRQFNYTIKMTYQMYVNFQQQKKKIKTTTIAFSVTFQQTISMQNGKLNSSYAKFQLNPTLQGTHICNQKSNEIASQNPKKSIIFP